MAIVFDEVVGSVEPDAPDGGPDVTTSAESAGPADTYELRRELARVAVRRARLFAD